MFEKISRMTKAIITGVISGAKRRRTTSSDAVSEALIGAATAVRKCMPESNGNIKASTPTKNSNSSVTGMGVSPLSKAKQYVTQLQ